MAFNDIIVRTPDGASMPELMQAGAKQIAALSDGATVMLGPIVTLATGENGIHCIFSHPERGAETAWLPFGNQSSALAKRSVRRRVFAIMEADLRQAMRAHFREVRVYNSVRKLAASALQRWPGSRAVVVFQGGSDATTVETYQEH